MAFPSWGAGVCPKVLRGPRVSGLRALLVPAAMAERCSPGLASAQAPGQGCGMHWQGVARMLDVVLGMCSGCRGVGQLSQTGLAVPERSPAMLSLSQLSQGSLIWPHRDCGCNGVLTPKPRLVFQQCCQGHGPLQSPCEQCCARWPFWCDSRKWF